MRQQKAMRAGPGAPTATSLSYSCASRTRFFKRDGVNLHMELPITVAQAILGAEIEIPTLSARKDRNMPEGTQDGTIIGSRARGKKHLRSSTPTAICSLKLSSMYPATSRASRKSVSRRLRAVLSGNTTSLRYNKLSNRDFKPSNGDYV